MGIQKKVYSIRLEEEFIETMKTYVAQQNRSLSNFIETVLKQEVERLKEEQRKE